MSFLRGFLNPFSLGGVASARRRNPRSHSVSGSSINHALAPDSQDPSTGTAREPHSRVRAASGQAGTTARGDAFPLTGTATSNRHPQLARADSANASANIEPMAPLQSAASGSQPNINISSSTLEGTSSGTTDADNTECRHSEVSGPATRITAGTGSSSTQSPPDMIFVADHELTPQPSPCAPPRPRAGTGSYQRLNRRSASPMQQPPLPSSQIINTSPPHVREPSTDRMPPLESQKRARSATQLQLLQQQQAGAGGSPCVSAAHTHAGQQQQQVKMVHQSPQRRKRTVSKEIPIPTPDRSSSHRCPQRGCFSASLSPVTDGDLLSLTDPSSGPGLAGGSGRTHLSSHSHSSRSGFWGCLFRHAEPEEGFFQSGAPYDEHNPVFSCKSCSLQNERMCAGCAEMHVKIEKTHKDSIVLAPMNDSTKCYCCQVHNILRSKDGYHGLDPERFRQSADTQHSLGHSTSLQNVNHGQMHSDKCSAPGCEATFSTLRSSNNI